MLPLLLAITLAVQATPAKPHTGVVAGQIVPPDGEKVSRPVLVILLPPQYNERWNTDVQQRLDSYWERYKPTFIQQKEMFSTITKMAYRDSLEYVVSIMRRDSEAKAAEFIHESAPDGTFEFKNVPFGNYKLLAIGRAGADELVWQDSLEVNAEIPRYIQLKKTIP